MEELHRPAGSRNFLLRLAYDGTDFSGWQIQPDRPTIQGCLREALQALCREPVQVAGAGRTDAGVHACDQAATVCLRAPIPCQHLAPALNDRLPESIRVISAREVDLEFHARRDALSKTYRYRLFRGPICPPWLARYVYPFPYLLDEEAMQEAAQHFAGTHDFRSLASADAAGRRQQASAVRTVFHSACIRQGDELVYTVQGNGFLYHMVRNLVGTLLEVGRRQILGQAIPEILASGQRTAGGPTAPARGLHLLQVVYPGEHSAAPGVGKAPVCL